MNWILFALTFYTVLLVGMYLMQTRLVYPGSEPRGKPELYGGVGVKEITLEMDDGILLTHWYKAPSKPDYPVVVAFHGNAGHTGDRLSKLTYLTDMGFGLFQVEYRGYAGHDGTPSEEAFKTDSLKVLAWLKERGYPEDKLIMYGESLGTGMAIWLASENPVLAVILEAPYSSIEDVAKVKYWYLPLKLLLKDKWKSDEAILKVKAPVFLFHGENDEVIPVRFSRKLHELIPGEKQSVFIKYAHHMDLYEHGAEQYIQIFLNKYVLPDLGANSSEAAK